jgi:fluoride ion exporter CrcB/FEX
MPPSFYLVIGVVVGGAGRYMVVHMAARLFNGISRWHTPLINVIGSFIIGTLSATMPLNEAAKGVMPVPVFSMIGICCGFAVVSLCLQMLELLRDGESRGALSNIVNAIVLSVASVILCIVAATLGHAFVLYMGAGA